MAEKNTQDEMLQEASSAADDASMAEAEARERVKLEDIEEDTDAVDVEAAEDAETPPEDGAADSTEKDGKEKKPFFKKKEKKDKRDEEIEALKERLVRSMAEFDNFRKRTEREKSQMFEIGAKDIVEKMLPILDNFERGFAAVKEEEKENPFVQGMDKVYRQMVTALEEAGCKPIEAVGQPFDPTYHNAVMHVEDETVGESIVIEEFQKGYLYRDSVVRFSMVKVAN